ncbi:MAG: oligosaccharide flippase family protein [Desulforhopalus sp.]|nr:oligosaccharide flippase family protein [Desulforhopalus sp.]
MNTKAQIIEIKQKAVKNISYNFIGKTVGSIVQAFGNIVLTRLLTASDFGIFSFANIISNLLLSFNDFGVNSALIQKKTLNNKELSTALFIKLGLGLLISGTAFFLAPFSVFLMNNEAIINVIKISSISFIISAFWLLPNVLLVRNVEFKTINKINTISTIITTVITVILAFCGFGYWSLVLATIINNILNIILYNFAKPIPIIFTFEKNFASYIYSFGGSVFFSKVLIQVLVSSDNFVVGYVLGSASLGFYSLAFNWSSILCGLAYSTIQTVVFPLFSRINNDIVLIRQGYLKVLKYCAFIGAVAYVTLFVISRDFIVVILGSGTEKWIESLSVLRIFCLYGLLRMIQEGFVTTCMAMGKPNIVLRANIAAVILQIALIYPAINLYGLKGVAISVTLACLVQYCVYLNTILKDLILSFKNLIMTLLPVIAVLPIISIIYFDKFLNVSIFTFFSKLFISPLLCILVHGIATKWELEREIYLIISNRKIFSENS